MSVKRNYYCLCDDNCRFPTMTTEQILAAIAQAIETGEVVDPSAGFITKVKETNSGAYVTFWVGTRAQYNALASIEQNCIYIITDDTAVKDFEKTMTDLHSEVETATSVAAEAKSAAAAAVGMVREFDTGFMNAGSYTTEDDKAKFYVVTLSDEGTLTSIVVDYMGIRACAGDTNTTAYSYAVYIPTEGEFLGRNLSVKMNADGTVTFTAPEAANIVHICGYY